MFGNFHYNSAAALEKIPPVVLALVIRLTGKNPAAVFQTKRSRTVILLGV